MLYDISLTIVYEYATPAAAGRHSLRLLPANLPGEQHLVSGQLAMNPTSAERSDRLDFFTNAVTSVVFRKPHSELRFNMAARVDRIAPPPPLDISPPLSGIAQELATIRSVAPEEPMHFLTSSPRLELHEEFSSYAAHQIEPGMSALAAVVRIGSALHRDLKFDSQATVVDTPPLEAFQKRHGVCQDFSHIMIACLRGIGIPAGYVSGFLRTQPPKGEQRLEGADAMHAWVRAWCGIEVGWIEYDPTNGLLVSQDHIVVARGRDYGDVAPVKGVLRTSGAQTTRHMVDVIPVTEAPSPERLSK